MAELAKHSSVMLDAQAEMNAGDLTLDAPHGKVFAANGCHSLTEPFTNNGGQSWKPQAYAELAARLSMGLMDCEDSEM